MGRNRRGTLPTITVSAARAGSASRQKRVRVFMTGIVRKFLPTAFWITATYGLLFSAANSKNQKCLNWIAFRYWNHALLWS